MRWSRLSVLIILLVCFGAAHGEALITASSSVSPASVYAGDRGYITITLSNYGTHPAYDIGVNVTSSSPEIKVNNPSWTTQFMDTGKQDTATFAFSVNNSASRNTYYIDFKISYTAFGYKVGTVRAYVNVLEETNLLYTVVTGNELTPGNNTIKVNISNPNTRQINNVLIKLIGDYPFSVTDVEKHLVNLPALSSEILTWNVWVSDVPETIYGMSLSREYMGLSKNSTINFRIHGKPDLTFEITNGSMLKSGGNGNIVFNIRNTGLVSANNIKISLEAQDPISIKNPEQYFLELKSNESMQVIFDYATSNDAKPGVYPLTLNMVYEESETHQLQLEIIGTPEIEIAGINSDPEKIYSSSEFTLSVQLENTGTGKAKSIKAVLTPENPGISGVTEYFVGSIDADDIDSAIFDLIAGPLIQGPQNINFNIEYEDLEGNTYNINNSLRVYVRLSEGTSFASLFVVLIVCVLGFLFRKRIAPVYRWKVKPFIKNIEKMLK